MSETVLQDVLETVPASPARRLSLPRATGMARDAGRGAVIRRSELGPGHRLQIGQTLDTLSPARDRCDTAIPVTWGKATVHRSSNGLRPQFTGHRTG